MSLGKKRSSCIRVALDLVTGGLERKPSEDTRADAGHAARGQGGRRAATAEVGRCGKEPPLEAPGGPGPATPG